MVERANTDFEQGFNDRQIHYSAGKTLGGRYDLLPRIMGLALGIDVFFVAPLSMI